MLAMLRNISDRAPKSLPLPSHRHATPSGPWPWMDLESEETNHHLQQIPSCDHEGCDICPQWLGYPQSHFPNWTPDQVARCKIASAIRDRRHNCKVYHVDVKDEHGLFAQCDRKGQLVTNDNQREFWQWLQISSRPPRLRVRALFIENLSGPVLQVLGACYNIEPFFFSSSLNWIPSRYQENVIPKEGDHITISLTFLRTMPTMASRRFSTASQASTVTEAEFINNATNYAVTDDDEPLYFLKKAEKTEVIETQAPLTLHSDRHERTLHLDILHLHMIRHIKTSTIISHHADPEWCMTTASGLQSRVRLIGESVYWKDVFQRSKDPTFLLIAILWHALCAWDQALEVLYSHICYLEGKVIDTDDVMITGELHIIHAHLLHYASQLDDFRKSVRFILDTPNPAMEAFQDGQKESDRMLLKKEGGNLLSEIKRLEMLTQMQGMRVNNVVDLVFSAINLKDSQRMRTMTETAVRGSEAMKVISYLTMFFLPAGFVAAIFSMNVSSINPDGRGSLRTFIIFSVLLSVFTIWVTVAFQSKYLLTQHTAWATLLWPIMLLKESFTRKKTTEDQG